MFLKQIFGEYIPKIAKIDPIIKLKATVLLAAIAFEESWSRIISL